MPVNWKLGLDPQNNWKLGYFPKAFEISHVINWDGKKHLIWTLGLKLTGIWDWGPTPPPRPH